MSIYWNIVAAVVSCCYAFGRQAPDASVLTDRRLAAALGQEQDGLLGGSHTERSLSFCASGRIAQRAVSAAGNFTGSDFTPRNTNESTQAGSPTSSAGSPSARSSAGSAICASSRASGAPKQKWMP